MGISQSHFRFKVEAWRKNPVITITDASSCKIAVTTMVGKCAVELCRMCMNTNKVALKLLAQPVFGFGLHQPETQLLVVLERPRIVRPGQL